MALTRAHVLVTGGLIMTPGAFLVFIPVKEKATHPLVKGMVRWAFFRGTVLIDVQTPALGVCRRGERSGGTLNTTKESGISSQGVMWGWGGLCEKLLRGHVQGKWGAIRLSRPNRILAEGKPG